MNIKLTVLLLILLGFSQLFASPVDESTARKAGKNFAQTILASTSKTEEMQLVMTTESYYVYNFGNSGFVIVSSDDRFRPIVGYSNEGPFEVENPSPEAMYYLGKIAEARANSNAVLFDNTADEWRSVLTSGKLISRNRGRGVDIICATRWNQNSPYNLYSPAASGGPGDRCYAGCVATAMSQVMKYWNHPLQGTGSHSYYCQGYGMQTANFGNTTYDWDNMPNRLAGASQKEIEAVALLMYHCAVAVDMMFSPSGSGAYSWDVPDAIKQYFSYSDNATILGRDDYSLVNWQNMLKEQFDLGWPVYYSGYSDDGGHAFVCDGYNDEDLFHFNWGWGGSSDGWFVIDEIDFAGWAQAIFNYVPSDVYDYMPLQPENLSVTPSGDFDYTATFQWTNPTRDIHSNNLTGIDQVIVTRNGEVVYTQNDVAPGITMSYTDNYMPAMVKYGVQVVVHNAASKQSFAEDVLLGPTCTWTVEMSSSDNQGWHEGSLTFVNESGDQVAEVTLESSSAAETITLPLGHIEIIWNKPAQTIDNINFKIKNSVGDVKVDFTGGSQDLGKGLFYIANNTCDSQDEESNGPTALTVQITDNSASLSWEAPEGLEVINYHIYRDNVLFAVTSNRSFTDDHDTGVFHSYYVTAYTDHGETTASNMVDIAPESALAIPTNIHYEMTSPTKAKIMWDVPEGETPACYYVFRRVKGKEFSRVKLVAHPYYIDNLTGQPNDVFEYAITAYYQSVGSQSGYGTSQDHPEMHYIQVNKTIIPRHLTYSIPDEHVILHWEEASLAEAYNIYRNGQLIGESNEAEFIDYEAVASNDYHYTVTGKTAFLESNPSNTVYVDWTTVEESSNSQNLSIYPNPTTDKVVIEGFGINQVRVFNMMGQEIQNQSVNQDRVIIDLATQPAGFYFIEIMSEQGLETKKIVKNK